MQITLGPYAQAAERFFRTEVKLKEIEQVAADYAELDMIGVLLQDEKIPGVHIAFGDPYGSQTGAPWKSRTHIDVLTRDCDVWIDDEQVIARGKYLLEKFELTIDG